MKWELPCAPHVCSHSSLLAVRHGKCPCFSVLQETLQNAGVSMEKYNLTLRTLQTAPFCNARVQKWLAVVFLTPLALFPMKNTVKKSLRWRFPSSSGLEPESRRDETFQDGRTGQSFSENKHSVLLSRRRKTQGIKLAS